MLYEVITRDDGNLALDPGIDDEIFAGMFRDGLDQRLDVGVVQVQCDLFGLHR